MTTKPLPNVFIPAVKVIDKQSPWNGKKVALLIEKGKITAIGEKLKAPKGITTFDLPNLHVSAGWVDMQAHLCDPGLEHKEDLLSGMDAAAHGGFTTILPTAATLPATDNGAAIAYVLNKTKGHIVDVLPCGSISKGLKGEEMAEMGDMHAEGARCFSDYKRSVQNPKLLIKALLYTKAFDGLVIHFPNDQHLAANGQINEGAMSTSLGLKAIPALAEELMVERDLQLLAYTEHKLHLSLISTPLSVQKIKQAKKNGLQVSCGVSSYHLLLNEEVLEHFDSNYKTNPPLRDRQSVAALIKGLKDETIDVIVSDHSPENVENKNCEFGEAAFGMINLQTAFATANTALKKHLKIDDLIAKLTTNPRKCIGMETVSIKEGETANLTFFDPELEWQFTPDSNQSKSANSPFFNKPLIGKPLAIYNKNRFLAL
jgi:dihydroorotase